MLFVQTVTVPVFSVVISPDSDWDNFLSRVVVPEEWRENFCMSIQIGPDQPQRKCVSTCGGNDNKNAIVKELVSNSYHTHGELCHNGWE